MKGHVILFFNLFLFCGVLSAQTGRDWKHTDIFGNIISVDDLSNLFYPLDTNFIKDNFVGQFFPSKLHDKKAPYSFNIVSIKRKGRRKFNLRAIVIDLDPTLSNILTGLGITHYLVTLKRTGKKEFEIAEIKATLMEI